MTYIYIYIYIYMAHIMHNIYKNIYICPQKYEISKTGALVLICYIETEELIICLFPDIFIRSKLVRQRQVKFLLYEHLRELFWVGRLAK